MSKANYLEAEVFLVCMLAQLRLFNCQLSSGKRFSDFTLFPLHFWDMWTCTHLKTELDGESHQWSQIQNSRFSMAHLDLLHREDPYMFKSALCHTGNEATTCWNQWHKMYSYPIYILHLLSRILLSYQAEKSN